MRRYLFLTAFLIVSLLTSAVPLHVWDSVSAIPVDLTGEAIAWDVVNLTWTPYDGARAYEIYRATDPGDLLSPDSLLVVVDWSNYPPYEAGKTYTQGDTVEYNGKIWCAKYWTQSAPGNDDSWELVGDVVPATSYIDQWNLTANTTYYYAVVPVLSDGSTGGASNALIITTPYEPYRIVAYYISWARYARKFYVSDIPWEKVTHINYAFLDLKEDGTVTYYDTYADPLNLEEMKKYKEKYPAVKVLVSVGGWTLSKYFSSVAADPVKRQRFAESVLEIIRKYNLDGVDIDWEYPGGGGLESNYVSPDDGKNFVLLLKTIREVFDRAEKADHKDYLITAAVPADPVKASRINWTEASRYLDSINVMTYDYHGAWESITGHNAPLYADPNAPYTDPNVKWNLNVNASIQWYIGHVPDKTKITLGLPFYSRSFANVPPTNNGLYQPFSGTPDGTWGPASETYGIMDYWDVAEKNQSSDYDYHWDPVAQVAWLYSPSKKVFITFDDPKAIGIKVDYALLNGIGGVMVWEITADRKPGTSDHPLLDTILGHLKEKPPAWIPDTYYIGSSVPANLTVPEPSYDNSTQTGGGSNNQTGGGAGDNQTGGDSGNQTGGNGNGTGGGIGDNSTGGSSDLVKPDSFSVKVNDWGNTEYDVTLDLGAKVDWVVKVKLREGSSVSSFWSVSKAEEGEYIIFTPASWNKGPTASFGFIVTGSKPVEAMYLYIDDQLWDVWPDDAVPGNQTGGGTGGNQTDEGTGDNQTGGRTGDLGNNTTYIPAGPGLPEHFFAPYIDVSLGVHRPLVEYYNLTGTPYFTLAFILYSSAYNGPSWAGGIPLDRFLGEVRDLREAGGDVIISFGGALGPYLCQQVQSAEQLADWYIQIADLYNATYFDFDIESSVNADLLADALVILQRERPWVRVSFTLPSDPGAGLVGAGSSIIQTMKEKGVEVDRVNPMTMDYYWTPANADNAISVAEHLFTQLKQIYPDKSDEEIWGMIGLTPMIDTNDDRSVFTLSNAQRLVDWAVQHGIRSLAFWSVDRDHPGPSGQVSPRHRGTGDPDWAFSHEFVRFMTAFATTTQARAVPVPA